jgi:hypothetical protein
MISIDIRRIATVACVIGSALFCQAQFSYK